MDSKQDPRLPGGLNPEEILGKLVRRQFDRQRLFIYGWFAAFFFNEQQRRAALEDRAHLLHALGTAEAFMVSRPSVEVPGIDGSADDIIRAYALAMKSTGLPALSEITVIRGQEPDGEIRETDSRLELLDRYADFGISVEPGFEKIVDTLPSECAFMQSMITKNADDLKQSRFFFGHFRPLVSGILKTFGLAASNREGKGSDGLCSVLLCLGRFVVCEETLFKCGYSTEPACVRTLN